MYSVLDKDISSLNLSKKISEILKNDNINNINDLWIKNRRYLKDLGITDKEIKEITIKLELNGLDLNKRFNK